MKKITFLLLFSILGCSNSDLSSFKDVVKEDLNSLSRNVIKDFEGEEKDNQVFNSTEDSLQTISPSSSPASSSPTPVPSPISTPDTRPNLEKVAKVKFRKANAAGQVIEPFFFSENDVEIPWDWSGDLLLKFTIFNTDNNWSLTDNVMANLNKDRTSLLVEGDGDSTHTILKKGVNLVISYTLTLPNGLTFSGHKQEFENGVANFPRVQADGGDYKEVATTTISGKVYDHRGIPIDGVKVTARYACSKNPEQFEPFNEELEVTSTGDYRFQAPIGFQIAITASKDGYISRSRLEMPKIGIQNVYNFGSPNTDETLSKEISMFPVDSFDPENEKLLGREIGNDEVCEINQIVANSSNTLVLPPITNNVSGSNTPIPAQYPSPIENNKCRAVFSKLNVTSEEITVHDWHSPTYFKEGGNFRKFENTFKGFGVSTNSLIISIPTLENEQYKDSLFLELDDPASTGSIVLKQSSTSENTSHDDSSTHSTVTIDGNKDNIVWGTFRGTLGKFSSPQIVTGKFACKP